MTENTANDIRARLDIPYDEAVESVTAALQEQGFGVLTEIDVKATLKKKIDQEFRRYIILGACNPVLAHQALSTELEIGLLMPCNVIVYEDGDGSVVSIADPNLMASMSGGSKLDDIASQARAKLEQVMTSLQA